MSVRRVRASRGMPPRASTARAAIRRDRLASRPANATVRPEKSRAASVRAVSFSATALRPLAAALLFASRLGRGDLAALARRRRFLLLRPHQALLQRFHKVNHLARLRRLAKHRLLAGGLASTTCSSVS